MDQLGTRRLGRGIGSGGVARLRQALSELGLGAVQGAREPIGRVIGQIRARQYE
jgi:hypothetical protein